MLSILDLPVDHERLKLEIAELNIEKLLDRHMQLCVQCRLGVQGEMQLLEGIGSLEKDWDAYDSAIHKSVPNKKNPLDQAMFTETCEIFKNTYIEDVLNLVNATMPIVRTRLMRSKMKTCLSMHRDYTRRIHIPIETNPNCFMVVDDQVLRLPFGNVYLVDTTLSHTAINASSTTRTHLVFCCLN